MSGSAAVSSAGATLVMPGCGSCANCGPGASTASEQVTISADGKHGYIANMRNRGFATTSNNIDLGWVLGQRLTRVDLNDPESFATLSLDPQGKAAVVLPAGTYDENISGAGVSATNKPIRSSVPPFLTSAGRSMISSLKGTRSWYILPLRAHTRARILANHPQASKSLSA